MLASSPSLFEAFTQAPMNYIYWGAAILGSSVFIYQAVLMFLGFDLDHDLSGGDADFDADGMNLISIKTGACFVLGFGWTGLTLDRVFTNSWALAGVALAVGVLIAVIVAFIIQQLLRLSQNNAFQYKDAVGLVGEVYLRIDGSLHKSGKIIISVNGTIHELSAKSKTGEALATGTRVLVVEHCDNGTVLVVPA